MVVIETKSQILEMNAHEMSNGHLTNRSHLFFNCTQSVNNNTLPMTTLINEAYMRLKPLLYPCTIEFSLMCLTVRVLKKMNDWTFVA